MTLLALQTYWKRFVRDYALEVWSTYLITSTILHASHNLLNRFTSPVSFQTWLNLSHPLDYFTNTAFNNTGPP